MFSCVYCVVPCKKPSAVISRPAQQYWVSASLSLQVFLRQRQPGPFLVPQDTGNPEASPGMHHLDRIDASREWQAIRRRMPAFVRAPYLNQVAEHLLAVRDAAFEEPVHLKVWVVPFDIHAGTQ